MCPRDTQGSECSDDSIDEIVERFEDAWQRDEEPSIDDYLPPNSDGRFKLLVELVHVDLERRVRAGIAVRTEDYVQRFPALGNDPEASSELILAEIHLRHGRGDFVSLDDIQSRFPTQFGPLRKRIIEEIESKSIPVAGKSTSPINRAVFDEPMAESADNSNGMKCSPGLPQIPGYIIESVVGEGGAAIVYLATQQSPRRPVAIKMLHARRGGVDELSRRLRAEAEAVAQLQHPNIIQMFEVGEYDGHPFLVVEYLGGGSLHERLAELPLGAREAAELVRTLTMAVDAAHKRGIIHRDLKPSNVLFASSGDPKLADFGLAKQVESDEMLTQTGEILGTPSFMAPEQAIASHADVGPPTDVYALGAILYATLTGRPPFKAASIIETLEQVRKSEACAVCVLFLVRAFRQRLGVNLPEVFGKGLAESICHGGRIGRRLRPISGWRADAGEAAFGYGSSAALVRPQSARGGLAGAGRRPACFNYDHFGSRGNSRRARPRQSRAYCQA